MGNWNFCLLWILHIGFNIQRNFTIWCNRRLLLHEQWCIHYEGAFQHWIPMQSCQTVPPNMPGNHLIVLQRWNRAIEQALHLKWDHLLRTTFNCSHISASLRQKVEMIRSGQNSLWIICSLSGRRGVLFWGLCNFISLKISVGHGWEVK